jgi:hypothetical protein
LKQTAPVGAASETRSIKMGLGNYLTGVADKNIADCNIFPANRGDAPAEIIFFAIPAVERFNVEITDFFDAFGAYIHTKTDASRHFEANALIHKRCNEIQ